MQKSDLVTICKACNDRLNPGHKPILMFDPRKVGPEMFCKACRMRVSDAIGSWLDTNPAETDQFALQLVYSPTLRKSRSIN